MTKLNFAITVFGAAGIWAVLTFIGFAWIAMGSAQVGGSNAGKTAVVVLLAVSISTYLLYVWRCFRKLDR